MGALLSVIVAVVAIALGAAWVGGYLDAYQAKAQEIILNMMGENKASYGLKSNLKTKVTGDKDLNELQDNVADGVGSLVGKGGPGEDVGSSELAKIQEHLPQGISLVSADDFKEWKLDIQVLDDNPLYRDQTYRLQFRFSNNYPIGTPSPTVRVPNPTQMQYKPALLTPSRPTEAPEVTFQRTPDRPIPIHPHIYSNGIICLDLLGSQGWSPVQNVESVCMSIQSMLTGNTKNERPPGDEEFVRRNTQRPRDIRFFYDDNTV